MIIVGAGLAGLIAVHIFPNSPIIERSPAPQQLHRALLRFRTDQVSLITGIPFRKVRVHKGLWFEEAHRPVDIKLANMYSTKVLGAALSRSIWDLSSVDRFVAPEDFYSRLIQACSGRIVWGADIASSRDTGGPIVSTAPLPNAAGLWLPSAHLPEFRRAPILVQRYRVRGADVHQTVYFPEEGLSTYRASITGDLMIVESMAETYDLAATPELLAEVFGLRECPEKLSDSKQHFGKIAPIEDKVRKELIHQLSLQANVYSVGRFATWRNILLDDVVQDLRIVKGMIEQNSAYNRQLSAAR
jgi:hypothetical protein